ncbi:MAG: DinB family protein [Phycisphaerales bacterium]|nr:DinB family protein [Phycisphaerales bacterium]
MDIRAAIKGQYHAVLAMLQDAIEKWPEKLWEKTDGEIAAWRVAYHTLYFSHLYLGKNRDSFVKWEKHREPSQHFKPAKDGKPITPYTKAEILAYWKICDEMVDGAVEAMDLDRKECGFRWYKMPKLDHQFVNIRHIQHHAGILIARLRRLTGREVRWMGAVEKTEARK